MRGSRTVDGMDLATWRQNLVLEEARQLDGPFTELDVTEWLDGKRHAARPIIAGLLAIGAIVQGPAVVGGDGRVRSGYVVAKVKP